MNVRDERGFTVVEAVIVLFMIGAIGAATLSLLTSQDRFYSRLDDSVIAEQSLRASADLASSEIRMSVPEDIFVAVPESVTFAFDVYHAVVCGPVSGGIAVFVYDTVPNPNVTGPVGFAFKDPYVTTYEVARAWSPGTPSLGGQAQTACQNALAPTGAPANSYQAHSGLPSGFSGQTPARGAILRKFRELSYRFGPSSMSGGFALFRGQQELAGPFDPTSTFSYVMDDGTVQTTVTGQANLARIRRVRINAIAIDDDPRFDLQRAFNLDIPLRY